MDSGKLTAYFVFEQQAEEPRDAGGGRPDIWNFSGACWGELKPMGAFERMRAAQQAMEVTHWVNIRNCGFKITSDMRMRIVSTAYELIVPVMESSDRVFGIEGIYDPHEKGMQYRLMVREKQPGGMYN